MNSEPDIAVYYPNVIGKTIPGGSGSCAILVEGKDDGKGEAVFRVLERLMRKEARIVMQKSYVNERAGTFTLMMMCQLPNISLDDVVIELRKMKNVTNAQSTGLRGHMYDGMMFPLVLNDTERIIGVNPSLIFDVQEKVRSPLERGALLEAGRKYGIAIIASIKEKFATSPDGKRNSGVNIPAQLLEENAVRYLMATGWGKFSWDHGTSLERALVHDPPCPKGGTAAGNQLIEGLVTGLAEGLQGKRFSVVEDYYDPSRRALTVGMVEANIATKMVQQETAAAQASHDLVESEVRRISNSLEQIGKPAEVQEVSVPVESGRLNVTLTTKSPAADKNAPLQDDKSAAKILEQNKQLEEKTRELESLLKDVEGRISKTKEQIDETESAKVALDNAALLAQQYVTDTKSKRKKSSKPAYLEVLRKKPMVQADDAEPSFTYEEDSI